MRAARAKDKLPNLALTAILRGCNNSFGYEGVSGCGAPELAFLD